jgi:hypothetical protein
LSSQAQPCAPKTITALSKLSKCFDSLESAVTEICSLVSLYCIHYRPLGVLTPPIHFLPIMYSSSGRHQSKVRHSLRIAVSCYIFQRPARLEFLRTFSLLRRVLKLHHHHSRTRRFRGFSDQAEARLARRRRPQCPAGLQRSSTSFLPQDHSSVDLRIWQNNNIGQSLRIISAEIL